jgi:hypothetical protein
LKSNPHPLQYVAVSGITRPHCGQVIIGPPAAPFGGNARGTVIAAPHALHRARVPAIRSATAYGFPHLPQANSMLTEGL